VDHRREDHSKPASDHPDPNFFQITQISKSPLRHFEELNNGETAAVLGIHKAAASNRYVRALRRLKEILSPALGLLDDSGMSPAKKK
jgi:hypothetical protein